jgi:hypothetical protein
MVTELDVPVYFHPRSNIPQIQNLLYGHAPWLKGAAQVGCVKQTSISNPKIVVGICRYTFNSCDGLVHKRNFRVNRLRQNTTLRTA